MVLKKRLKSIIAIALIASSIGLGNINSSKCRK